MSILLASNALALGLGEIRVRSGLGQTLLAHTDLIGVDAETLNSSCLRARINSIDGQFLSNATVTIYAHQNKRALSFTTRQTINEPAVILVVDVNCEVQLHREFSILLDPPEATQSAQMQVRDESPFAGRPLDLAKSSKNETEPALQTAPKKTKRRENLDFSTAAPSTSPLPAVEKKSSKKSLKIAQKPSRDVLKLSDEVILPELATLPQGLRMSDVLSTEAGRELLQNTEELRAAQARMAAILRDDPLPVASAPVSNQNDIAAIAELKQETEKLRRQSAIDKAALESLKDKSQFDLWLTLLAGVAVVAVGVIGFLLYYIRSHVKRGAASWWESNPELARLDAESDSLIPDFQVEIVAPSSSKASLNNSNSSAGGATDSTDSKLEANSNFDVDSGFHRTPTLEETNSSIFNFFSPRGTSVKVEEISDVTQEAEFWISMNDPRRAIEILEPQEHVEHPDSPVPWLYLLDLYRTVEDAERYNQLRDRFIVHFNANIPEYDVDLASLPHRQLEDFPHLISRISSLWETHEIIPYLESLLVDDREGKRAGFDLPVYRDILMLLGIAHELERVRAIEAEMQGVMDQNQKVAPEPAKADPVSEAEFNMIEFETIDFPAIDLEDIRKKK
ncbi:hypothetical protein RF679_10060 [Undibacterium cyanobacteriorum]|uniref:FimV N-terminal domain-containing protein n=1 Tax=Undibacterium cyanobacteriorum TaxID=3073561 RepID=A0ABY9REC5_9BURK|nr:hypothetical protein [Undibacterium sp. 20NA77.5]WMW79005.1 hypothetical protein RF679_10060 [Undibacterium sp. 20NA77.5]